MSAPTILAFAGSLRKDSFNKRLVRIAAAGAEQAGAAVTVIDLDGYPLPVYHGDLEAADGLPENALKLKELFLAHDGLLIASPEYNSSLSAALKNTIDWVSRPNGDEAPLACFVGKVAGLMAASPGGLGGLRGLVHLRAILSNIQVIVVPGEVAVPGASKVFGEDGSLNDDHKRAGVEKLGRVVAETIAKLKA